MLFLQVTANGEVAGEQGISFSDAFLAIHIFLEEKIQLANKWDHAALEILKSGIR